MRIYDMKANHLTNPVGFRLDPLRLSWKADGTRAKSQKAARVRIAKDEGFRQIVYDSGEQAGLDSLCHVPGIALQPRTRYWWEVTVSADNGDSARGTAFFETGKMEEPWRAGWITAPGIEGNINLYREFTLNNLPARARAYVTGLGLYELYLNGVKVTDEVLTPYYNAYDRWVQVQAWDLDALLRKGQNQLKVMLGDGWFKGRFGFDNASQLYGDTQALLMEIALTEKDGQETFITTGPDWQAGPSRVRFANIYDGETFDATLDESPRVPAVPCKGPDTRQLCDRLSPPLRVVQTLKPAQILLTPAGETVVDLGQEITGYLAFKTFAPRGTQLKLSYFEILQDGNFFRDNLRSARQEQVYIADGTEVTVRPYFTFFGFRYVKLEGFIDPKPEDFEGCVIHSDLEPTLVFDSANPKVNRLQQNAFWGQRCNFLDVPTDCPQRDERMGWTGDAQAFSGTACFQMHCGAFFNKYLFDMREEQQKLGGSIPFTVPENFRGHGSCAWADAAAIIPWNLFLFYGDKAMLETQYPLMRGWVEWVYRQDEQDGGKRLWETGFHYADWLALDTRDGSAHGGTDPYFIASAYYYYSTSLLLKAARALNKAEDIQRYAKLKTEIFDAFQHRYFTPGGRLAQTTQTGYVCALFMELAEPEQRAELARLLARELEASKGALRTGFVGTPYLCRVLTREGYNGLAYDLLLREQFPGWLYAVNLGATTIWERWNSVLEDGRLSDIHMNSLNHYTYGSIMEWVYRHAAGLNPREDNPGFRSILLKPHPDPRLPRLDVRYESAAGLYRSAWEIAGNRFTWKVEIPFDCTAKAVFPFAQADTLKKHLPELKIKEDGDGVFALLTAGEYRFEYPVDLNKV